MSLIKTTGYCSNWSGAVSAGLGCFPSFFNPGLGAVITPSLQTGVPTSTTSTFAPIQGLKVTGHSWSVETPLNANNQLKYTGSYRTMDYNDQGDYDGTAANVFSGIRKTEYKTQSHELQVVGSANNINYVGGVYYFKELVNDDSWIASSGERYHSSMIA